MKYHYQIQRLLLAVLLLSCAACIPSGPNPTPEDRAALEELQKQFGNRYEFAFQYDVYVWIHSRVAHAPTREEAMQIIKIFRSHAPSEPIRFDEEGRLKNSVHSHIAYFNFYNREGKFLFRGYWSPQDSMFEFSEQQFPS